MNITDRQPDYVVAVTEMLKNQGVRATSDLRNEKLGFKIREHTLQRVPYLLVAGDKEVAANLLSVRTRSGKDLGTLTVAAFVSRLQADVEPRPHCFGGMTHRYSIKRVRRNEEITSPSVRVIGADGSQVGVLTRFEALQISRSPAGLDLVEVSPKAEPPVVRDHGFRQVPVRTEQEDACREAQAEADPDQGSKVSSRYG